MKKLNVERQRTGAMQESFDVQSNGSVLCRCAVVGATPPRTKTGDFSVTAINIGYRPMTTRNYECNTTRQHGALCISQPATSVVQYLHGNAAHGSVTDILSALHQ